jgi:hypothetical protein
MVVGVKLDKPDMGGSMISQLQYFSVRGQDIKSNTFQIDGMLINGLQLDGQVYSNFNDAMNQEVSYQTSGLGAETAAGGVRINMIPREGGNSFGGSLFSSYSDGAWQSNNLSNELRRQVTSVDKIHRIYDFNPAFGGPLIRDKLWFFSSARIWGVDVPVGGTVTDDGQQGIDDTRIKSALTRLTWQISPRNKFTAYYDRSSRFRSHTLSPGVDPETASGDWRSILYYTAQAKWTSTVTSKLLLEAGYSAMVQNYLIGNQPAVKAERFSSDWYKNASRQDLDLGTRWAAASNESWHYPGRFNYQSALTYVTGSHNLRGGVQWNFGDYTRSTTTNGDLNQRYRSGVPDSVTIYNTPLYWTDSLNADLGMYAQDSWTRDRLTVSAGLRLEHFNASVKETYSGQGRFMPARRFDEIPNLPNWTDWAPRFGVVYDLFGNAKTALKLGLNRYNETFTTGFTTRYNPQALRSVTVRWRDINRDDIAQDSEIDLAALPTNFGTLQLNRADPDIQRPYNNELMLGVQHELMPRVSVGASFSRRTFHNLHQSDNLLISASDYVPLSIVSPLDGSSITIYNLDPTKQQLVDVVDTNASENADERSRVYTGLEFTFNARLPHGATLFGGATTDRTVLVDCDNPDDPNALRFCDQRGSIPLRTDFKLAGTQPLPLGFQVSAVLQSYAGQPAQALWSLSRSTRYAPDCLGPCTPSAPVVPNLTAATLIVPLEPVGERYLERQTSVDVSFQKWFTAGTTRIKGQVDLFNAFNVDSILTVRSTNFGTPAYLQPGRVLQGRILRIATQISW